MLTISAWLADLATNLLVSLIVFAIGFLIGKRRERALLAGRNLEQYDFYPFTVDQDGFPAFSLPHFERAVRHFLRHRDALAVAQLIVLGEQNGVRNQLDPKALADYERLYARNHGQRVMQDSSEYLENYRRIVRLLGATFRDMGIEVLLHDLVNPSRSITCIAGGEVTGRIEGMGTTSLVIDLKRRLALNQDKLNYGLQIGARNFKCTTIPTGARSLRRRRRGLHEHRHQLRPRPRAGLAGEHPRVPRALLLGRHAAGGEHPQPARIRKGPGRQAPLARLGRAAGRSLTLREENRADTDSPQAGAPAATGPSAGARTRCASSRNRFRGRSRAAGGDRVQWR